jgi:TrmH family RNA methyltransferase
VAQAMRDPGNLGTMLRTADAVGAGGLILLDDCVDPFSVEAVRASMGAIFTEKLAVARWEEFLPWLRGGEGKWWRPACAKRCPIAARPMRGRVSSWWATDRAGCQRNMKWPATCA